MTVKYNFKLKPFEHQLAALHKGVQRKEFGYFMEMGTGKSKVLIDKNMERTKLQYYHWKKNHCLTKYSDRENIFSLGYFNFHLKLL